MIKINGQEIPAPAGFDWTLEPQSATSERNANGLLNMETLPEKVKLVCTWKASDSLGDLQSMITLFRGLTRDFFEVTYPDPDGSERTIQAYLSPITCSMLNYDSGNGASWRNFKVSMIER